MNTSVATSLVLHVVLNDFKNDSRVLKETQSVAALAIFSQLVIAALWDGSDALPQTERLDKDRTVRRIGLKTRRLPKSIIFHALKYCEWVARILCEFWAA